MIEKKVYDIEPKPEKAVSVALIKKGFDRKIYLEHLDELEFLAETAGADVIGRYTQELSKPYVATLIGPGKIQEIKEYCKENEITLVIFDDDLSPVQLRNLEKELEIKVIDRSGLILDIFAKRARTLEAKTQVELAQYQYLMPRLTRMWTHLSKQYGGIGTKGPGETQIETDRRILKTKIQQLKEKLAGINVQKEQQRKGRDSMPRFALVGYTNAGKSTLMRTLTESDVYVEDKLFATLDTTVRKFSLPSGLEALLSDTVGFIRKLPPNLVASFRTTLAEAREADVLLHVVDCSHEFFRDHIRVVDETLEELKIQDKPQILVLNKIDRLEDYYDRKAIEQDFDDAVFISASEKININLLLETMQDVYNSNSHKIRLKLPYSSMDMLSILYKTAEIVETVEMDEGIEYKVRIQPENLDLFTNKFGRFFN
jgi:GTP-binding protein HflX